MSKAAVAIVRGNLKFFVNDPAVLPMVLASLDGTVSEKEFLGQGNHADVFALALRVQGLIASSEDRHFANLRDAIFGVGKKVSNKLLKS